MKPSNCISNLKPYVGSYVLTYGFTVGLVTSIVTNQENEEPYSYYRVYNMTLGCNNTYDDDDIYVITEELAFFMMGLNEKMRNYLTDNVLPIEDEYADTTLEVMERRLTYLDRLIAQEYTTPIQKFILSTGIEKIIRREKNNGNRIVKLNNGEIWKVHRVKNKTSNRKRKALAQYCKNKRVKNHTTHYELIEKLC